ncbi:hypothetical protein AC579_1211 [Pseudocercospora musae]|uniref:Aromatic amino acid beta-eliminating lyase/threonine aldolase domain-containing protein n=1 Tax=Pseudocercospora musae TaxID=113226 RepID=A0A139HZQ6_9PEZI|nr:hypothetical protein AC579_1211 [Pseudocercospora musae]
MTEEARVVPVADCDNANSSTESQQTPVHLSYFLHPNASSPSWVIERTKQYTDDPVGYLKQTLGEGKFTERQSLLHIPEEIDKDHYGGGKHKQAFEEHIAKLLGKKHGLFFITGVQAQLIALKIHAENSRNNRVAWHLTSHLEDAEEVLLELPNRSLGCTTYTFSDLQEISQACRAANVKLHLDGARLWEGEPYYRETFDKTFSDIGALFDSVYKGLQGIGGAMLVCDSAEMISRAKKWQRRSGGNCFTLMYQFIDDERGFNENIVAFAGRRRKMIEVVEGIKEATKGFMTEDGRSFVRFVPEEAICCQTHAFFQGFTSEQLTRARDSVQEKKNVRVFERLREMISFDEKMRLEREAGVEDGTVEEAANAAGARDDTTHFIEWSITNETEKVDTKVFVDACDSLQGAGEQ